MSAERLMAESPAVRELEARIRAVIEASGAEEVTVGSALALCIARFWAGSKVSRGETPVSAGGAVISQAAVTAELARKLTRQAYARRRPTPSRFGAGGGAAPRQSGAAGAGG